MNTDEVVALVQGQGFAVVADVLPKSEAAELRAIILDLRQEDRDRFGEDYLYRIGQEGFVANVADRHAVFEEMLNRLPLKEALEKLLGLDMSLYLYQGVIVPPGGGIGAFPWKWHCDLYHVADAMHDSNFLPGVNMLIYLDNVDSENGATWLAPGTQGMTGGLPFGDPEFASGQLQLAAPAGSAVLFNPLLWHCAGANSTNNDRCALKMLMARSWMMPQVDYFRSVRESVRSRLSDAARAYLGERSPINLSFDELERELVGRLLAGD